MSTPEKSSDARPDTSPEAVEKIAMVLEYNGHTGGDADDLTVANTLRALSAQLTEAREELKLAHRHLGTALGQAACEGFGREPGDGKAESCCHCGHRLGRHVTIQGARAYSAAHPAGGEP